MGSDKNWERFFSEQRKKEEAERLGRIGEEDRFDPRSIEGAPTNREWLILERANADVQEEVANLKGRGCCCDIAVSDGYMTHNIGPQMPSLNITYKAGCTIPEHRDKLAQQEARQKQQQQPYRQAPVRVTRPTRKPFPIGRFLALAFGVIVLLLLLLWAASYYGIIQSSGELQSSGEPLMSDTTVEQVFSLHYDYINEGNYQAAYELFAEQSREQVSYQQYEAFFTNFSLYRVENPSFLSVQVDGNRSTLNMRFTIVTSSGEERYEVTQQAVLEDGSWRIIMRQQQIEAFVGGS